MTQLDVASRPARSPQQQRRNVRGITIPLVVGEVDRYRAICDSLQRVRMAARQAFAVMFCAQAAGASIEVNEDGRISVRPNNRRARSIMAAITGKTGKAALYQLRPYVLGELIPEMRSFVWDDLRRFVWARWQAKDPEFTRATRGWLTLQNARDLAMFKHSGIGFPPALFRGSKSDPFSQPAHYRIEDHSLVLDWDRALGPVEFRIGTLDPGRWHHWRRIVAARRLGRVEHGTVILNERDGRLRIATSFAVESRDVAVDPARAMTVTLAGRQLVLAGPDGGRTIDHIDLCEAIDWCSRVGVQQERWARRQAATGSPGKPWGERRRFRAIANHRRRVTELRENGVGTRNGAWSRRIATRAEDWRCGRVLWAVADDETLAGHPWGWARLRGACEYKLAAIAATLEVVQKNGPGPRK